MFNVSSSIGLDISGLHKDGIMLYALWLTMMNSLQKYITIEKDFKYPTSEAFQAAYPDRFQNESDYEKRYLWLSANWMNILLRLVSARKNKGLFLYVVPKLVEGWDAKYVTGSGQTKATAARVHIFETEGNVTANQRGKARGKKRQPSGSGSDGGISPRPATAPKPKKARRDPVLMDAAAAAAAAANGAVAAPAFTFTQPFGSVAQYREQRQLNVPPPMPLRSRRSEGSTDLEDANSTLNLNEDVKSTFAAWQEATENYGFGLLNLSRDNSWFNNGLAQNVEQQLTDPLDYQRGFSWTEIPVAPAPLSTANSAFSPAAGWTSVSDGVPFVSSMAPVGQPLSSLFPNEDEDEESGDDGDVDDTDADSAHSSGVFVEGGGESSNNNNSNGFRNRSRSCSSEKLNLEVGAIVPVAGIMDMFQGYSSH